VRVVADSGSPGERRNRANSRQFETVAAAPSALDRWGR
jgi:hypothetical protein